MNEKRLMSLGDGFNSLKKTPIVNVLKIERDIHVKLKPNDNKRNIAETNIVLITDHDVLRRELGVHFQADVDVQSVAGGSLSGSYTKKLLSNSERAFLLLSCSYLSHTEKVVQVEFSDSIPSENSAHKLAPADWVRRCGDKYVSEIDIGKKLFALIQISSNRVSTTEVSTGHLEASVKKFQEILTAKGEIDVKIISETLKDHRVYSIKLSAVGVAQPEVPSNISTLKDLLEWAKQFSESVIDKKHYAQIGYRLSSYEGDAPDRVQSLLNSRSALEPKVSELKFVEQQLGDLISKFETMTHHEEVYVFEDEQQDQVIESLELAYDLRGRIQIIISNAETSGVLTPEQQIHFSILADKAQLALHTFFSDSTFVRLIKKKLHEGIVSDSKPKHHNPRAVRSSDSFNLKATEKYFFFQVRSETDDPSEIMFNIVKKDPDEKHAVPVFTNVKNTSKRRLDNAQFKEFQESSPRLFIGNPHAATDTFTVNISKVGFLEVTPKKHEPKSPAKIAELEELTRTLFPPRSSSRRKKRHKVEGIGGEQILAAEEKVVFPDLDEKKVVVQEPEIIAAHVVGHVSVEKKTTVKDSQGVAFFSGHSNEASPYVPAEKHKKKTSRRKKRDREEKDAAQGGDLPRTGGSPRGGYG